MSVEQPSETSIYEQARAIGDADKREAYLQDVCGADEKLQHRVRALLEADIDDGFLERPPVVDGTEAIEPLARVGAMVGKYKLLEQIGEGGFGAVFMAEQQEPVHRRVALKIIKPGMDTRQVIARFEAEQQALAMMDHPNIAKVLDAGTTDRGRPFFVMELVRGMPITNYCDEHRLEIRERMQLFIMVCRAIHHAHQKGIIHRDIKPTNVLVTLHDGEPIPKVIDFGVAKALNQRLTDRTLFTGFSEMIGTPLYMSPEQAELSGIDVDTRTDIYSLGVLLYELLTGTTPFERQRLQKAAFDQMRKIIREEEPQRPSLRLSTLGNAITAVSEHRRTEPKRLTSTVRGDLDWIVMKSLEKNRARRYETANDLANDAERFAANKPIEARPPSITYLASKAVKRHKGLVASVLALTITLVVASIVSFSFGLSAQRANRISKENESTAIAALSELASEYSRDEERFEEAEELYGTLLDLHQKSNGPASDDVRRAKAQLAAMKLKSERVAEALPLFQAALASPSPQENDDFNREIDQLLVSSLGQLWRTLGKKRDASAESLEACQELLKLAMRADEDSYKEGPGGLLLAIAQYRQREHARSLDSLDASSKENLWGWAIRAANHYALGDTGKAMDWHLAAATYKDNHDPFSLRDEWKPFIDSLDLPATDGRLNAQESVELYRKLLAARPEDYALTTALALSQARLGDWASAMTTYERGSDLGLKDKRSNVSDCEMNWAAIAAFTEDHDSYQRACRRALRYHLDDHNRLRNIVATCCLTPSVADPEQALKDSLRILEKNEDRFNSSYFVAAAMGLYRAGRTNEARSILESAPVHKHEPWTTLRSYLLSLTSSDIDAKRSHLEEANLRLNAYDSPDGRSPDWYNRPMVYCMLHTMHREAKEELESHGNE